MQVQAYTVAGFPVPRSHPSRKRPVSPCRPLSHVGFSCPQALSKLQTTFNAMPCVDYKASCNVCSQSLPVESWLVQQRMRSMTLIYLPLVAAQGVSVQHALPPWTTVCLLCHYFHCSSACFCAHIAVNTDGSVNSSSLTASARWLHEFL